MPTYEYACDACDHKWEEFQSINAPATQKCPECGKKKARRLISAGGGFLFKGTGFYITDYRSDSYKKSADSDKKSPPSDAAATTKPETKSETKSETKPSSDKKKPAKD